MKVKGLCQGAIQICHVTFLHVVGCYGDGDSHLGKRVKNLYSNLLPCQVNISILHK